MLTPDYKLNLRVGASSLLDRSRFAGLASAVFPPQSAYFPSRCANVENVALPNGAGSLPQPYKLYIALPNVSVLHAPVAQLPALCTSP